MKTSLALILLWTLVAGSAAMARAVCLGVSVNSFGAKGDGHTDDTAAIQAAINAASLAGGGSVVFSVARYYTTGTFVLPQGVVLCGVIEGPFDVAGVNPTATAIAPTLLVTNWPARSELPFRKNLAFEPALASEKRLDRNSRCLHSAWLNGQALTPEYF